MRTASVVDPSTLTEEQVKEAISVHCRLMGSHPYYYADELERWRKNPSCLRVFEDVDSDNVIRLRAYTEMPLR